MLNQKQKSRFICIFFYCLLTQPLLSKNRSQLPFNGHIPISMRLKILKPMFSPAFDTQVELSREEVQQFREKKSGDVYGYIKVSPPKGYCLIVTRRIEEADDTVCKPTSLAFGLKDLDKKGEFSWKIKTGPDDFGTVIRWRTPYRMARLVDLNMPWPGPVLSRVVTECEPTRSSEGVRKVYVHFLNGDVFSIGFPEKDELIPQPEDIPNLYVQQSMDAGYFDSKDGAELKKDKKKEGAKGEHEAKPAKTNENKKPEGINWQISPRLANTMSSSFFMGADSLPPLKGGECRYRYEDDEASGGLVECHKVSNYKWVFIPLICLSELKPK